jgi:hypothetical protein
LFKPQQPKLISINHDASKLKIAQAISRQDMKNAHLIEQAPARQFKLPNSSAGERTTLPAARANFKIGNVANPYDAQDIMKTATSKPFSSEFRVRKEIKGSDRANLIISQK